MKIFVVNDEIYRLTEEEARKVMRISEGRKGKRVPKTIKIYSKKEDDEMHEKACNYVMENFEPILIADIMWRND